MASRATAAVRQLELLFTPPCDPRLGATLHRIDEARALVVDMLDGVEPEPPPKPLPLSAMPAYEPPEDWRMVVRIGRMTKDGTRRGGRVMRRLTAYFTPDVFEEMAAYATFEKMGLSELIETAVIEYLEKR